MLKSLRDGAKSTPMRIFLIVLAIGFALWGIDDVFRAVGSSDKAVKVGSVEVSALDAAREFERARRRYMPSSGTSEAIAAGLLSFVLADLSQQSLFIAEADRIGLTVTREMEKQAIADEPAFRDENGRFSTIRFNDALASVGLGEAEYLGHLRRSLMRNQLMDAINGGMRYPAASAEALARWRLQRRSVGHATIPVDPDATAVPDDAAVRAWYAENSTTFDAPDLRYATVLLAGPEAYIDEVVVDEALLAEAYGAREDLYQEPERRQIKQMIFDEAGDAAEAVARLRGGEEFPVLALAMQGLSSEDIDLGEVTADDLTEAIAEAAFGPPAPGIADPVATPLGHHVLEIVSITPSSTTTFEDARESLAAELREELAIDLVYERVNLIDEALAAGSTLEEAARDNGARLALLDGMDRNGLDGNGDPVSGDLEALATDTVFRESVWTAAPGEPGIVEESGSDSFFVVRVDREEGARPRELGEVRDRVVAAMRLEAAIAAARATAIAVTEASDPAAAAAEAGLEFVEAPSLRRNGVGLDHAAARLIAARAFELGEGESGYVETGSETVVVTTTAILEADSAAASDEKVVFGEQLSSDILLSSDNAVLGGLEERFDARVNPGAVQQILIGATN